MTRTQTRVGPLAAHGTHAERLDIDALLTDPGTRIIVTTRSFSDA